MALPANGSEPEVNRLLASLPRAEYEALLPDLSAVQIKHKQWLSRADESIEYVYFPRGAVISILALMADGRSVEGATVGWEGMAGLPVFLGDASASEEVICQVAGPGARMPTDLFQAAFERSPGLDQQLRRYSLALMGQIVRTAGCNRLHPAGERCARWLLMTADRVGADEFPLTQGLMAAMLGVRRPSVTVVAGMLQQAGLIHYRRGIVTILDREGLEEVACEDYQLTREIYKRLYQTVTGLLVPAREPA